MTSRASARFLIDRYGEKGARRRAARARREGVAEADRIRRQWLEEQLYAHGSVVHVGT